VAAEDGCVAEAVPALGLVAVEFAALPDPPEHAAHKSATESIAAVLV
jgi:hypothetical protein